MKTLIFCSDSRTIRKLAIEDIGKSLKSGERMIVLVLFQDNGRLHSKVRLLKSRLRRKIAHNAG
jgi:hypothetical protein